MSDAWRWLESTRELQETAYGVDLSRRLAGAELADNLVHQGFALVMELAEVFGEIQWKNWAKNRGAVNRDAAVGELVDVAHFIANLLVHLNVTDEEWERLYRQKQDTNRQRQLMRGGYDALSTKCPGCRRELDKPGGVSRDDQFLVCKGCDMLIAQMDLNEGELMWHPRVDGDLAERLWAHTGDECTCDEYGMGRPRVDSQCPVCKPVLNQHGIPM